MKTAFLLVCACIILSSFRAMADSGDDTLRFYLSKTDTVLLGKITSEPFGIVAETGAPLWLCDFKVSEVLKGDVNLTDTTVRVSIKRFERDAKDHHPLIKKDSECILFLHTTENKPPLETADYWFGVQHPNSTLTFRIRIIEAERSGDRKRVREIIDNEHKRLYGGKQTTNPGHAVKRTGDRAGP